MRVPISGQITGQEESYNVSIVANSTHYGGGMWTKRFERGLAVYTGRRFAAFCNSGSSANLLALAALELPKGSYILTCAVNFPTTVNAIIQLGHVPVFVDADPKTLNAVWFGDVKADAAILAHTLGNPLDIPKVDYPVIEDMCDALGSEGAGSHGVMATTSFYPAHHITTGEGGAVLTDDPQLNKIIRSYRDWGRDCWCCPGEDDTCGKRYAGDYDHKYTYSRIGWNLKASDFQAAVGVAQLEKADKFKTARQFNWRYLRERCDDLPIQIVEMPAGAVPFGFAFLTDRRNELARYLDGHGVGNRPIMGGNLTRQPAYKGIDYRVIGSLDGADEIHRRGIWLGCYPGIDTDMMDYTAGKLHEFYR